MNNDIASPSTAEAAGPGTAVPVLPAPPTDSPLAKVGMPFIFAFAFAYAGFWIACLMPGVVTLALKVQTLVAPEAAAGSLSLIAGVGVLLPLVIMPVVGRLSDRTTARIGMRRPYLLVGAV